MASDLEVGNERTPLLGQDRRSHLQQEQDEEAYSIIASTVTKEEQQLAGSTVGERLPYNDYTTIDWLHDLAKDSYRYRSLQSRRGLRHALVSLFDACSGWIAVIVIGALTACIAFLVDVAVATVSDWKVGYCSGHVFRNREACCKSEKASVFIKITHTVEDECEEWKAWTSDYTKGYAVYVGMALAFGIMSSSITMLTKTTLPSTSDVPQSSIPMPTTTKPNNHHDTTTTPTPGKTMYMASGSGIPEIKTILSGFTIPSFLSLHVLVVKAAGAIFAVSSGLCLGKEGPFVHISTCVGQLTGQFLPKYRTNGRKMRELLSAACSSGLSVAFGAPIGGVLFSYEEISTYFPRKVLWHAFLCSLTAAMVLRELNPTGTGKLVLFESDFQPDYRPVHYFVFVLLGLVGGLFGGAFCKLNFLWSRWFRAFALIRLNPVLEVALVVLVTALVQYPHPLVREPGDMVIKNLLMDCGDGNGASSKASWVCWNEKVGEGVEELNWRYVGWLAYGTLSKLVLTTITFGVKVPSGVIIPALDAGALFGRLVGQFISGVSPAVFAMVGAAAFLAGVSRMTISLAVIMFELTSSLPYTLPSMLAILVAKCTAEAISSEGVYDLAQTLLSHPFLDPDVAISIVRKQTKRQTVDVLIPPKRTMGEITVLIPRSNKVGLSVLREKSEGLRRRGLMDAGLVLVQKRCGAGDYEVETAEDIGVPILQGYISQSELEFGLDKLVSAAALSTPEQDIQVRLLGHQVEDSVSPGSLEMDLAPFVDQTPLTICAKAPLEYAVEMFSKLGLRYLMVTEEGTGKLVGVIIKKRLVGYLEHIREHGQSE